MSQQQLVIAATFPHVQQDLAQMLLKSLQQQFMAFLTILGEEQTLMWLDDRSDLQECAQWGANVLPLVIPVPFQQWM